MNPAESSTLPRGFKFRRDELERTPEPAGDDLQQPSAPRQRMKLRRRRNNNMSGPTELFMAAAFSAGIPLPTPQTSIDIPLPSIEISEDAMMVDAVQSQQNSELFASHRLRSLPRTPLRQLDTEMLRSSQRKRDWYLDDDDSHPSSATTDISSDSMFGTQRSLLSDYSFSSIDTDSFGHGSTRGAFLPKEDWTDTETSDSDVLNGDVRHRHRKNAYWTKDMSDHVWYIYQLYLQDSTVTPYTIGSSGIPPPGVLFRVAREAKRSWKGPKPPKPAPKERTRLTTIGTGMGGMDLSDYTFSQDTTEAVQRSVTPTNEDRSKFNSYLQWPHSTHATKTHLKEMCKRSSALSRTRCLLESQGSAPYSMGMNRHRTPNSAPSTITPNIVGQALETKAATTVAAAQDSVMVTEPSPPEEKEPSHDFANINHAPRLGSPFSSTYGPSSSSKLVFPDRPASLRTHSDKLRQPLRPPLGFNNSTSLNGTMKRRAQYALDEEMSPNLPSSRPTIMNGSLFSDPNACESLATPQRRVRSRGFTIPDQVNSTATPMMGNMEVYPAFMTTAASDTDIPSTSFVLASSMRSERRLASPFEERPPGFNSNTFPRQLASMTAPIFDPNGTIRRYNGSFATVGSRPDVLESPFSPVTRESVFSVPARDSSSAIDSNAELNTHASLREARLSHVQNRLRELNSKRSRV